MCNDTPSNLRELEEIIEPIKRYLDGLIVTLHTNDRFTKSDLSFYLEQNKGEGEIIYRKWVNRHDISMNEFLWCGAMDEDSYCILVDTLERPILSFVSEIKYNIIPSMQVAGVDCLIYASKPYIFKFSERLKFVGSPHWGLQGCEKYADFTQTIPDESLVRLNVRDQKRKPFDFVEKYLSYYLYPEGSNHCLLGLEKNGNVNDLFPIREQRRLNFRKALKQRGYPLSVKGIYTLIYNGLDKEMKSYFNEEKILNDYYRLIFEKREDFKDDHDFKNMIRI